MQVDFYQLGHVAPGQVIVSLADKILKNDGRLVVVADDEVFLARLDRQLWGEPGDTSFMPHGVAGGADDARQPVLLSTGPDAPNSARNLIIADGKWREAALSFDRSFFLFDDTTLEAARLAWKLLAGREGVERRYWASEDGKWVKKG